MSFDTCTEVSLSCPVEATLYGGYFNRGGNIFFNVVFGIAVIYQVTIGIRSKTWSFMAWCSVGALLEFLGYIGRILMSYNPWDSDAQKLQLVCLILAPTFLAAGISITFKHIFNYCGPHHSWLRPKFVPYLFVGLDVFSIIIQAAGGGVAAASTNSSDENSGQLMDVGNAMLLTGVIFQVINMVICGFLVLMYIYRYKTAQKASIASQVSEQSAYEKAKLNVDSHSMASVRRFRVFCWAMAVAYLAILVRCCYRIPEMAGGWGSELMQDEVTFLVLDGAMIAVALILLSIFHPGMFFTPMSKPSRNRHTAHKNESDVELSDTI